jgi:hypothetical protein
MGSWLEDVLKRNAKMFRNSLEKRWAGVKPLQSVNSALFPS